MFKQIADAIKISYHQETPAERWKRMLPGVLYGALTATVFVWVSSFINLLFFPDLHLAVNWVSLLTSWVEFGVALALAGAIVGWFTETYSGIVWGGLVLTILQFVWNMIASLMGGGSAALTLQSFITFLPLIAASVLLAGAMRVAINRQIFVNRQEDPVIRQRLFAQLIGIVLVVGLIPGVFSRYGTSSEATLRSLNQNLQGYATDPYFQWRYPFAKFPALKDHFGQDYRLYVYLSTYEAGSMDVTIRFEDGYSITCLVPTDSGSGVFLQVCSEGTSLKTP